MEKAFLLGGILVFFFFNSLAQNDERAANLNFKNGNFVTALDSYLKLHKKDTSDFNVNLHIGLCYIEANKDGSLALPYLRKALEIKPNDPDAVYGMARALMHAHEFEEASSYFQQFKTLRSRSIENNMADVYLQNIRNAQELTQIPLNVSFFNLGENINSNLDETSPFVSSDEQLMFFTTNRKYDREFGVFIKDVYLSAKGKDTWKKAKGINGLSTMEDEAVVGIGDDFLLCQLLKYEIFEDIAIFPRTDSKLGLLQNPGVPVNGKETENGAWLSNNQDTLFFSSDRPGGKGGFDLYMCVKLPDGRWGNPVNLGEPINSLYDEDFPQFLDGNKLYFASNRPESIGGFDIFVSAFNFEDKTFSEPHNLGYPINSTYDNMTISFGLGKRYAYVSDIRPEGFGGYDIYKVVFNNVEPPVNIYKCELLLGSADSSQTFVNDSLNPVNIQLIDFFNGQLVGKFVPDVAGDFVLALSPGKYKLIVVSEKTETKEEIILVPDEPVNPVQIKLYLKPFMETNE